MKIAFTGSHGTGKTTLASNFNQDIRIDEVARKLIQEVGHPKDLTEEQLNEFETEILSRQITAEKEKNGHFVSDRSVIDVLAYAITMVSHDVYVRLQDTVEDYLKSKPYDIVFYTPIEFPLEKDGVRFEDDIYQCIIDGQIKKLLKRFNIEYITLTGSVEERLTQINNTITNENIKQGSLSL